jgi:hypothetical protein
LEVVTVPLATLEVVTELACNIALLIVLELITVLPNVALAEF